MRRPSRLLLATILAACTTAEPRLPASAPVAAEASGGAEAVAISGTEEPRIEAPIVEEPALEGRRVFATEGFEEIRKAPSRKAPMVGLFRAGQSLVLKTGEPVTGDTPCAGGWYAVEPFGFVCVGPRSTLDTASARLRGRVALLPDVQADLPYSPAVSLGSPRYRRVPTVDEQREAEPDRDKRRAVPTGWVGTLDDRAAGHSMPPGLEGLFSPRASRPSMPDSAAAGARFVFARSFDAADRAWLVTPEGALVPRDRALLREAPARASIALEGDVKLPLAFVRPRGAALLGEQEGKLVPTEGRVAARTFLTVRDERARGTSGHAVELSDGRIVKGRDVSVFRPRRRPTAVGEHERWVAVSVSEGTLVTYEGDRPVRALAMSAGAGGANGERFGTPIGGFRVAWKMVTSDMSGNDQGVPWRVAHVPWVAYYQEGYAVHGAWWHDGFGEPRSHGCLNLTPADARELFGWMDPQLPAGWYAVAADFPWSGGRLGTYIDVGL